MFDLLVSNYKNDYYNKRNRKLKAAEILMIVLLIASGGSLLLSSILELKTLETLSLILILFVLLVVIIYTNIRDKKLLESDVDIKNRDYAALRNYLMIHMVCILYRD
ncbi:MAG: hypothetical protein ILA24_00995 [Ruminococcus sp.]|nr:hypothetical protein [Ruminococcus sp.]